ncbi:hypothetical protein ARMGADRAFT_741723 [Armillaria gallica]|uniref:Uncharacterized protein n=1 Tax=Armillaria gallica TaxID=47427 RepID=A0A2H3D1A5_ARMGA|nr:hypothetical protein ARMGADRAFT_741723 [Armillaria gallica]
MSLVALDAHISRDGAQIILSRKQGLCRRCSTASTFLEHDLVCVPRTEWIEPPRVSLPSHDRFERSHGADRSLCLQHVFLMEIRTTFLTLELYSIEVTFHLSIAEAVREYSWRGFTIAAEHGAGSVP